MTGGFFAAGIALLLAHADRRRHELLDHVLPTELVMSLGLGFVFVPLGVARRWSASAGHDAGVASAMVNATQQVGGSLGTALLNTIAITATTTYVAAHLATQGKAAVATGTVHGYTVAFGWTRPGHVRLGALVSFAMIRASKEQLAEVDASMAAGLSRFPASSRVTLVTLSYVRTPRCGGTSGYVRPLRRVNPAGDPLR